MGCLLALIAMVSPRFAFALVWIFSDRVSLAFDNNLVPFIGLLFFPWTVLTYTVAYAPIQGVSGLGWAFVVFALFLDLASYGSGETQRRQRSGGPVPA